MQDDTWTSLIRDLQGDFGAVDYVDRAVRAAEQLDLVADQSRIPDLYALLESDDFFVREAAALPLTRLEGLRALPRLFRALVRGEEDGHDNDLLGHFIAELIEEHRQQAAVALRGMLNTDDDAIRELAAWGLGFVAEHVTTELMLEIVDRDQSPKVRAAAIGSLSSAKGNPLVVDRLLELLDDREAEVRDSVVSTLGYLGDKRALEPLKAVLREAKGNTRALAEHSIKLLSQKPAASR